MSGCGAEFFGGAIKLLEKLYGDRLCDTGPTNDMIRALGEAERAYKSMPPVVSKKRKTSVGSGRATNV